MRKIAIRSSPAQIGPVISSRCTPLVLLKARSAKKAATARPIRMATTRSKETVTRAVTMKTKASERVESRTLRAIRSDTIRAAVTIRTPDRAARGTWATTRAAR